MGCRVGSSGVQFAPVNAYLRSVFANSDLVSWSTLVGMGTTRTQTAPAAEHTHTEQTQPPGPRQQAGHPQETLNQKLTQLLCSARNM